MTKLFIPAGVPGCGKSTFGRSIFGLKVARVSTDEIRKSLFGDLREAHEGDKESKNHQVFDRFHYSVEEYLRHSVDVYADATSLNPSARSELRHLAKIHHTEIHLLVFTNVQQAIQRNADRSGGERVPDEVMSHFFGKYYDTLAALEAGEDGEYTSVTYISKT